MILSNFFYSSIIFNKLVNKFIKNGRKEKIELIIFKMIIKLSKKQLYAPFIFYIFEIIQKQLPIVWTKIYFKKGEKIHIPFFPSKAKKYKISYQLLFKSIIFNRIQKFEYKFENTLFSYFNRQTFYFLKGIQLKEEIYNITVLNRNLKHYRWKQNK